MTPEIAAKFIEMAKKMGISPETLSLLEKEISKPTTVVVAKVTKASNPEDKMKEVEWCCNYSDEEIDKMDEKEVKDCLKKCRDACKEEEWSEWEEEDKKEYDEASKNEMKMQDIFNRIG